MNFPHLVRLLCGPAPPIPQAIQIKKKKMMPLLPWDLVAMEQRGFFPTWADCACAYCSVMSLDAMLIGRRGDMDSTHSYTGSVIDHMKWPESEFKSNRFVFIRHKLQHKVLDSCKMRIKTKGAINIHPPPPEQNITLPRTEIPGTLLSR